MSDVKRFHKKEAAIILVELRNKTEDERLMDCRRQLLTKDKKRKERCIKGISDPSNRSEISSACILRLETEIRESFYVTR